MLNVSARASSKVVVVTTAGFALQSYDPNREIRLLTGVFATPDGVLKEPPNPPDVFFAYLRLVSRRVN